MKIFGLVSFFLHHTKKKIVRKFTKLMFSEVTIRHIIEKDDRKDKTQTKIRLAFCYFFFFWN